LFSDTIKSARRYNIDQNKINEDAITNYVNNIHKYLEFKLTEEENNNLNYLDLSVHRNNNNLQLGIYRKPTQTDSTVHFTTNHPLEHQLAVYNFSINRMLTIPITEQAREQKWYTMRTTPRCDGFPLQIIRNLKNKLIFKTHTKNRKYTHTNTRKKWIAFTYYSPLIHRVTKVLKSTNLNIAFRTYNTIYSQLCDRKPHNKINSSGIYKLQSKTYNKSYVGQSVRSIEIRHRERTRYVKTNNPVSAHALHIIDNRHEYGNPEQTMQLFKTCS
jgi:hypothetical protein